MAPMANEGFRCIAFDRRGHGRSAQPSRGYDYDTLADDLAAVIERLDLCDAMLIGHSMAGGEIVRYLSRHRARRVSRIVLIAPTTPFILKTLDNPDGIPKEIFDQARAEWSKDYPKWLADNARPRAERNARARNALWVQADARLVVSYIKAKANGRTA
jgi:non-heme chloroperoxidase